MDPPAEPPNPYAPTSEELATPQRDENPDRLGWALIAFFPGAVIGLNVAIAASQGVAVFIRETVRDPLDACFFSVYISVVALAFSIFYRLPRRFLFAPPPAWWAALLASGFAMTFLPMVMAWVLESFSGRALNHPVRLATRSCPPSFAQSSLSKSKSR